MFVHAHQFQDQYPATGCITCDESTMCCHSSYINQDESSTCCHCHAGGAVTLAHEFGHYLGLMHTHEGSAPCDGDGFEKADAVPDTPVNLDVNQYAGQNNLLVNLTTWCSDFRTGNKPSPSKLLVFNSCSKPNRVDNVFNLLSYTPDPCCMILTENQVARLQWSTASFRPKMVEAYQV